MILLQGNNSWDEWDVESTNGTHPMFLEAEPHFTNFGYPLNTRTRRDYPAHSREAGMSGEHLSFRALDSPLATYYPVREQLILSLENPSP